jgi:hypothetical protein
VAKKPNSASLNQKRRSGAPSEEFCEHKGQNFENIPWRTVHKTSVNRILVEPAWESPQVKGVSFHARRRALSAFR